MNVRVAALLLCLGGPAAPARAADAPDADARKAAAAEEAEEAAAGGAGGAADTSDPDALFEHIRAMRQPAFDDARATDRRYAQGWVKRNAAWARRRADLAATFVEKFPHHPRTADALYLRAESLSLGGDDETGHDEVAAAAAAFVEAAPADPRAADMLFALANLEQDRAKQAALFRKVVDRFPGSETAGLAEGTLRRIEAVGKPFALEFTDAVSGKRVSTADLKGKVVVIDFWTADAAMAEARRPRTGMRELYAKHRGKVEFIGVNLDAPGAGGGPDEVKQFAKEHEFPWPQFHDADHGNGALARRWGVNVIPTRFVIDPNGDLHSADARDGLDRLIPQLLAEAGNAEPAAGR
jgi:TolA-binding protein/peroxiredoxin